MKKNLFVFVLGCIIICISFGLLFKDKNLPTYDILGFSSEEKIYTLSQIWNKASEYYAHWDQLPGLDWDFEYQQAISRISECDNNLDFYKELYSFVALLEDGHTQLYCPGIEKLYKGILPLSICYFNDGYYVNEIEKNLIDKIPLGSQIIQINAMRTETYLEKKYGPFFGIQTPGVREDTLARQLSYNDKTDECILIQGLTPDGEHFSISVSYKSKLDETESFGEIDSYSAALKYDCQFFDSFEAYHTKDRVYIAKVESFLNDNLTDEFADWIQNTKQNASAYMIDVRGNHGGDSRNAISILSHFVNPKDMTSFIAYMQQVDIRQVVFGLTSDMPDNPDLAPEWRKFLSAGTAMYNHNYYIPVECGNELPKMEGGDSPQIETCRQPLVILSDWYTSSAGESLLIYAQDKPSITVIGTNTKGTTGQLLPIDLPKNMVLYLTAFDDRLPNGQPTCNKGIQPDIWVEQTVQDSILQNDTVLLRALDYLEDKR